MTLPFATRQVSILRAPGLEALDSYDTTPDYLPVADVRAVISGPAGSERTSRAQAERVTAKLIADPCELTHLDRVRDDCGTVWLVEWVQESHGLGLDHVTAGLVRYDGQVP